MEIIFQINRNLKSFLLHIFVHIKKLVRMLKLRETFVKLTFTGVADGRIIESKAGLNCFRDGAMGQCSIPEIWALFGFHIAWFLYEGSTSI